MAILVRRTMPEDIAQISDFLTELKRLGKRTLPSDKAFVQKSYVEDPSLISSCVAVGQTGGILGIQILKRAGPNDPYGTPEGWGTIGTHVRANTARQGIGRQLFAATLRAAKAATVSKICATIGAQNQEGLGYYEAMGFRTFEIGETHVSKCYSVK